MIPSQLNSIIRNAKPAENFLQEMTFLMIALLINGLRNGKGSKNSSYRPQLLCDGVELALSYGGTDLRG
jgi:hypothetical protein